MNPSIMADLLKQSASTTGFELTQAQIEKFKVYAEFLVEYNEKVNLTAITDESGIAIKHFLDSLMLLKYINVKANATMIDVGTGAGFPSVPVKILREDIKLTLLDSLNKRVVFLNDLCSKLSFDQSAVHFRAEEAGQNKNYREKYDIATARAVANLRELCEYCLPFVKQNGIFVALKGPNAEEEIEGAKKAITELGGRIQKIIPYTIPDEENSKRTIIIIEKISQTSSIYPRPSAKIAKKPLI